LQFLDKAFMTTKKIIYWDNNGSVVVLNPYPEFCGLTVEQIAKKDVPFGLPYQIVEESELPTVQQFTSAWEIDQGTVPQGFGEDYGVGSTNAVIGYDEDGNPVLRSEA
jgi:hypothetical protein